MEYGKMNEKEGTVLRLSIWCQYFVHAYGKALGDQSLSQRDCMTDTPEILAILFSQSL